MKKILFIMSTDDYSGAEAVNFSIIKNLKEKYSFYWVSKNGKINAFLEEQQIQHIPISELSVKEIRRVVKEHQPDILHATDYKASVICALAKPNVRILSHLHNNSPWIQTFHPYSFLYWYCARRFEHILTVSESIEKEYVFAKFMHSKFINISNPVERNSILNAVKPCDKIYDVCVVGRLTKQKNPLRFIHLISILKKDIPSIQAVMVGDGDLRETCQKEIDNLGLRDTILLTGFEKNPFQYMAQSRIFCLPSNWEGFGLVAFEAMTVGLPTFTTPVGGLIHLVDSTCGALCESDDAFVHEMKEALLYSDTYKRLSEGAIKKSRDLDNSKEYMNTLKSIYEQK